MSVSGQAGIEGWYRGGVTLTLSASDDVSGVAGIEYSLDGGQTWQGYAGPFPLSREGIYAIMHRGRDRAGNVEAYRTVEVKLDITPPSISGAAATSPNASGWYSADVTVHFSASDGLSGVAAVTPDIKIATEGAGQPVTGTVTDKAGNTAAFTVSGINIDKTPPVISGAAIVSPNAGGWYNTDVTVHFTATDGLSGVESVTPDVIITAEGANQATGTALDRAGNTASATVSVIKIDKTAPVTNASPATQPNAAGWYNTDVTVHFTAGDELSGVETVTPDITITNEGAGQTTTGSVVDKAGNSATFTVSGINLDKTAPVISGVATTEPNANGWYNSDVTVHFTAGDELSGVETVTPDVTITTEGANQSVTGTAVDKAGNTVSVTVGDINIDKTRPVVAINVPADGEEYLLNANVPADWTASDTLSGIARSEGTVPAGHPIDTASVGTKTFNVNAEDNAGNSETITSTYYIRYIFSGVLNPIKADGSSVFKGGSAVPVKFRLSDADGNYAANATARLYLTKVTNGIPGADTEAVSSGKANEGNLFRYDSEESQYIFNLNTKELAPGAWRLRIALDDGTSKYVNIGLK